MSDLIIWWQNLPGEVSPVIFEIGSVPVRWYSVMYLVAFAVSYALIRYRINKNEASHVLNSDKKQARRQIDDFYFWGILGVIAGGRLGYMLFYNFVEFIAHPWLLVWPFSNGEFTGLSGMSFHGGVIGVALAIIFWSRRHKINLWQLADLILPTIPLAYTFGRLGNWLNGELWGRTTDSAIGQYFAGAGAELRHPSQLYEAALEGILLFVIIWPLRNKLKKYGDGVISGIYLVGYALGRIVVEFFRQPDAHIGFLFAGLTLGQLLSGAMLIIGGGIIFSNYKSK